MTRQASRWIQSIARTRQAHAVSPIRFVIIDYLQLISLPGSENRSAALGDITRARKVHVQRPKDCLPASVAVESRP